MNDNTWQTLHRVSARIETDEGEPVEFFWVEWRSDLYWYLGDTLGYIINRHLNDSGNYVSVDTSYMIGFNGMEVPTSNTISYSNSYGELNNMIAPVRSMIGDTLTLTAIWYNSEKRFRIVLDQENKMDIDVLNSLGYIEVIEISIWLGIMYYGKCWIDSKFKQEKRCEICIG